MNHIPAITYPTLLIAVFANQFCLPIPSILFLITAGALVRSGSLHLGGIILTGVVGCLLADFPWFLAGRRCGYRIVRGLCAFSTHGQHCAVRGKKLFARWGMPSLIFAKFIPGLDGLMPPLAGMLDAESIPFLVYDGAGALFWTAGYCFVGYLFADRIEIVAASLSRMSSVLTAMLAIVLCYLMWRAWELVRTMRQLRLQTISPTLLQEKLQAGKKIAVLDLLDVEGHEDINAIPGIPGAARISPIPLRSSAKVQVPFDIQMVLCCSSPNQITSARTALLLRRKGISNVWVLEGGLKAWKELGLPLTTTLSSAAELAARFGVELPE